MIRQEVKRLFETTRPSTETHCIQTDQ